MLHFFFSSSSLLPFHGPTIINPRMNGENVAVCCTLFKRQRISNVLSKEIILFEQFFALKFRFKKTGFLQTFRPYMR